MRRAVHAGALLSVLVATVAASAASVAARALPDVSAQYGRATPRVPLPFEVTEATCRRFTIGVVQQDGAGSLTVEVNDRVAHRQAGVHLGPPIQGWWPRNLLLVGENSFRVTAYVHSRLHVFNGKFQCPSGLGLATPVESLEPTPKATPRAPIVGPPGKGFTPSPTATEATSTPGDATATASPTSVPTGDDPPSPTADPSTASPEATSQQSPTPSTVTSTPTAVVTGVATASLGLEVPSPIRTPTALTTEEPGASTPADQPSPEPTPVDPGGPISSPGDPLPIDPPPDHPSPSPIPSPIDSRTPPPPAPPPTPPVRVPDDMPPAVEFVVDVIRGGRGYTAAERQEMAERRKSLQEHLLNPSLSASARNDYESESTGIDKELSPLWDSPVKGRPLEDFQEAWRHRIWLLWLIVAAFLIWRGWRHHTAIKRRLLDQSSAANSSTPQLIVSEAIDSAHSDSPSGEAHISLTPEERGGTPVGSEHTWSKRVSPRRDRAVRKSSATVSGSSAVSVPSEPRAPSSVVVTSLTPTERYGQDPKTVAADYAMKQIVIPTHRASRMEATVVDGQPGVRFDRDSTLFYPLTGRLRRAFFNVLASADRPLRMSEINNLLPHDVARSYQSGTRIWREGAEQIPSKIFVHNIIRQTCEEGPWVLDLDALPSRAVSAATPETA